MAPSWSVSRGLGLFAVLGALALCVGALVALFCSPTNTFLVRGSATRLDSQVVQFRKLLNTTCVGDERTIFPTLGAAYQQCGAGCLGVLSLRCMPIYGYTLCDASTPPSPSPVGSCVFAKANVPPTQGPPPTDAQIRAAACKVSLRALLHGMCPAGASLKATCGPSQSDVFSACEMWHGSLGNFSNISDDAVLKKILKCKADANFSFAPGDAAGATGDNLLCMDCNMDSCMDPPTWSLVSTSRRLQGTPSNMDPNVVLSTPDNQSPPDGSLNHCRPVINGQVSGVQLRVRREIHAWSDDDFAQFRDAVNKFRSRKSGVEDEADYPNTWGAFTVMHKYGHGFPDPGGPFMPWHRKMLFELETQLQVAANNCSLTLPYWNSNMEAGNPLGSTTFRANRYGGEGHHANSSDGGTPCTGLHAPAYCVANGIAAGWRNDNRSGSSCARCVCRMPGNYTLPSSVKVFHELQSIRDFGAVNDKMNAYHVAVHAPILGGTMGVIATAPRDPMFYAHHAYVDRLLNYWLQFHVTRGRYLVSGPEAARSMNFFNETASEWTGSFHLGYKCALLPTSNPRVCLVFEDEPLPQMAL